MTGTDKPFSSPLDPWFTFGNFVKDHTNEMACMAALRVADYCSRALLPTYNPLLLYGDTGVGKTHLMQAIGCAVLERAVSRPNLVVLSAERFKNHLTTALSHKTMSEFNARVRLADLLLLDDVQLIAGKPATEEAFFHTFNEIIGAGKQIVLASDQPPHSLTAFADRVRSRLSAGLVVDIKPPSFELRRSVLKRQLETAKLTLSADILDLIANRVGAVREIEGMVKHITARASMVQRTLTHEDIKETLAVLGAAATARRITIAEIQSRVAEHYSIRLAEMTSNRRARVVARPRQVAMYLAKRLTARSTPEIGRKFGGRDHTTVMYAVSKVEELSAADATFAAEVEKLRRSLDMT